MTDGQPQPREFLARPGQRLKDHLRNVAGLAERFAREARLGDEEFARAARWAGLLHDLGKYSDEFQAYIRGEREGDPETYHAIHGGKTAFEHAWLGPAFVTAGHHSGLHDLGSLQAAIQNPGIFPRWVVANERFSAEIGALPPGGIDPAFAQDALRAEFYTRMLFSCLTDADCLDSESANTGEERSTQQLGDCVTNLLDAIMAERQTKPREGRVNQARHAIFDQCVASAVRPPGFFSLTVPTGGGKTIAGMAFALAHARQHGLRRVIVVIPYLSIIEQNAADYRRILDPNGRGLVMEHHSAVKVPERRSEIGRSQEELAADNWDAPVIVTTSVQFVESLFARSSSRCRKLHNICHSVVILDEVQTLPNHLLNPLLSVLRELKTNYGVSVVFSTATQPAFRHSVSLKEGFRDGEVTELAGRDGTEVLSHYRSLQRVSFKREEKLSWKALAQRMAGAEGKQTLCVLNLRRHAFSLWEALREALSPTERDSLFHLSSALCAEHRLWLLGEVKDPRPGSIRHRLHSKLPCRLVSTQVVEAGVDLDFPLVFRALGPLDSIVQAAGRCNREGGLMDSEGKPRLGQVVVFSPEEGGGPPGVYRTATSHAASFIERLGLDRIAADPGSFGEYFSGLFGLVPTDRAGRRESTIQEDRAELRFREVARKACVIEDDGQPVVVPYGAGRKVIEALRDRQGLKGQPRFTRHDLRRLQRFMVNVREHDLLALGGAVKPLLPNLSVLVLEEACYHKHLGVLVDRQPTEDLCGV